MTSYVILFHADPDTAEEGTEGFTAIGKGEAASEREAVRKAAEAHNASGIYAAVPERSWKPREVTVSNRPQVFVR